MSNQFKTEVGLNIQRCRKKAGVTQKELADRLGLSEGNVSKYEAGDIKRVDIEMVMKIADALSCSPDDITGWKTQNKAIVSDDFQLSDIEKDIIRKFRLLDDGQRKMFLGSLGIQEKDYPEGKANDRAV